MADTLRARAIRLLARRERSRAELRRLLDPQGTDAETVSSLLDNLQQTGWLSETRLAEQLVRTRRSRGGVARLRHEMARRGLDAEVIANATASLEGGDLAAASALWQRKFGVLANDRVERERQLRFLVNRGFSRATALKVVRAAGAGNAWDGEE